MLLLAIVITLIPPIDISEVSTCCTMVPCVFYLLTNILFEEETELVDLLDYFLSFTFNP